MVLSFVTHCATFSQTCGLSGPRIILLKQEAILSCKMLRVKFLSLFTSSCICAPASIAPSSFHGPSYLFQNAFLTGLLEVFPDAVLERKQELFPGLSFLLLLSPRPFHVHVITETRIKRSLHQRELNYTSCSSKFYPGWVLTTCIGKKTTTMSVALLDQPWVLGQAKET